MSPGEMIRVLIVDDITETRENLKKLLYFETDIEVVGTATNGQEAIELSKQYQPHIVLMDINMPELDGIAASAAIRREVPFVQIIMMSVQSEADYLRRSMMAGASDFLTKPFGSDELVASIRRVFDMSAHLRAIPAAQMISLEAERMAPRDLGKVISVYSPKGGVGCTTIAINVAIGIHMIEPDSSVALMDCSLQFGDVGVSLNLRTNRTVTDLVEHIGDLDPELVESTMTRHDASGIQVLLAPAKPEDADLVTAEHVRRVLETLRRLYSYVVIDLGSRLQDLELGVFDLSDRILLITVPEVPSVKDVRYFFELVEALEYPREKILLILNQSDPRTGVTSRLIEGNVKHKIFAEIPYERRIVLQSVNQGVPYMIMPNMDKRAPPFQNTIVLAQSVLHEFAEKVERDAESGDRASLGRFS